MSGYENDKQSPLYNKPTKRGKAVYDVSGKHEKNQINSNHILKDLSDSNHNFEGLGFNPKKPRMYIVQKTIDLLKEPESC